MKFLFVVNNYPPSQGGVQTHVASLAESLASVGNSCIVVTIGSPSNDQMINGVRVVTIAGYLRVGNVLSFPRLGTAKTLRSLISDEEIDCVSVHTRFFPMTWLGVDAAKEEGCVSILTEHGSGFVKGIPFLIKLLSWAVDVSLGRRALRRATLRLAISSSAQNFVRQLSGMESTVFHNAILTHTWIPNRFVAHSRLIFIGRIVNGKGWKDAVNVFNAIAAEDPLLELEIFGSGPEMGKMVSAVAQSPFSQRMHIRGPQPSALVARALAGSVLLNPTMLAEGFQTTLIEAFVSGARVVTYPTPGIVELKNSGASIWVADDVGTLVECTRLALASPSIRPSDREILTWDWSLRSAQFAEIANEARGDES
jgi:glycosyltransferase involved in cell wall biosynthesis